MARAGRLSRTSRTSRTPRVPRARATSPAHRAGGGVRHEILRVATRHLAAHGFDGVTIQAVADEVGVSKPSVLHHFRSKEALYTGVIAAMLEHWGQLVPQIMLGVGGQDEPFDHLLRELIRFFTQDPDRARLFLRETLDRPDELRRIYVAHLQPWISTFAAHVREGQRRALFRSDVDPESYLRVMLQLVVGSAGTAHVLGSADARTRNRELLRIVRTTLFYDATAPRRRTRGG